MTTSSREHPWPDDDVVVLRAGPARLEVALTGATPVRWLIASDDGPVDLLDGYEDPGELVSQDGVRNGIMAPFCNRVADGRYTFDGVEHDLLPGKDDRTIYHGLVRTEPFTVVELEQRTDSAVAVLRCTALEAGTAPGYPFRVVVDVTYRLAPTGLEVDITGVNVGDRTAPFASGWHPYFRLPGAGVVDRLHLDVPSTVTIRTDDALLPLPGDAAFEPHDGVRWHPVGDAAVDAAFTGLRRRSGPGPGSGRARTTLADPVTGVALTLEQDRGLVHVFTGDTLARDRRRSIAVEPAEAMTDAFNRPDQAEEIRLGPGDSRTFSFAVTVTGTAAA